MIKISNKTRNFIVNSAGEFLMILAAMLLLILFLNQEINAFVILILSIFLISFGIYLKKIAWVENKKDTLEKLY